MEQKNQKNNTKHIQYLGVSSTITENIREATIFNCLYILQCQKKKKIQML